MNWRWKLAVPILLLAALARSEDFVPRGLELEETNPSVSSTPVAEGGIAQSLMGVANPKSVLPEFNLLKGAADLTWEGWFAPNSSTDDEW